MRNTVKVVGIGVVLLGALVAIFIFRPRGEEPGARRSPGSDAALPGSTQPPTLPTGERQELPLPDPPRAPAKGSPRDQLARAGDVVQAFFAQQTAALPKDLKRPQDWATNLPLGWFQLLVRAFPDEAFEIYSTQYLGDPDHSTVAYWALGELARLRHEPTFQLFNAQLESGDPVRARRSLKALANYDAPQLGPRLLALVPAAPKNADETDLAQSALRVAASNASTDPAALERLLKRYDGLARDAKIADLYGTNESRLRAEALRSGDLAGALAKETDDPKDDLERAEWAANVAVRSGRKELVPALLERIQKELKRLKEDERLDELDILGRQAKGHFDVPSVGGLGGLEEVRTIAQLRRAVLDLGGTLSDEERRWLDGLRMLRTPKEYLREAGLVD